MVYNKYINYCNIYIKIIQYNILTEDLLDYLSGNE